MLQRSRFARFILASACVVGFSFIVSTPLFILNNRPSSIHVPVPKTPAPNAWDDFVLAGELAGRISHPGPYSDGICEVDQWSMSDLRSFVKDNQPVLTLIRRGLERQYLHPPIRSRKYAYQTRRQYGMFIGLGYTLLGEARYYKSIGNHSAEVGVMLDCVELGVTVPRGGSYITGLVGRKIEAMGLDELITLIPDLSSDDLAYIADRMQKIQTRRFPYSDMVLEDCRVDTALFTEAFNSPRYRGYLRNPVNWFRRSDRGGTIGSSVPENIWFNVRCSFANKNKSLREYQNYCIAISREQRGYYTGTSSIPVPDNIILIMASDPDQARRRSPFTFNETVFLLTQTEIALHRYHTAYGRYPDHLGQLVPQYLDSVPVDPFGRGKALVYRSLYRGANFLLYSRSANMRDDGGKSQKWQGYTTPGDIVAGKLLKNLD